MMAVVDYIHPLHSQVRPVISLTYSSLVLPEMYPKKIRKSWRPEGSHLEQRLLGCPSHPSPSSAQHAVSPHSTPLPISSSSSSSPPYSSDGLTSSGRRTFTTMSWVLTPRLSTRQHLGELPLTTHCISLKRPSSLHWGTHECDNLAISFLLRWHSLRLPAMERECQCHCSRAAQSGEWHWLGCRAVRGGGPESAMKGRNEITATVFLLHSVDVPTRASDWGDRAAYNALRFNLK